MRFLSFVARHSPPSGDPKVGAYLRPPEHGSGMAERTVRVGLLEDFQQRMSDFLKAAPGIGLGFDTKA